MKDTDIQSLLEASSEWINATFEYLESSGSHVVTVVGILILAYVLKYGGIKPKWVTLFVLLFGAPAIWWVLSDPAEGFRGNAYIYFWGIMHGGMAWAFHAIFLARFLDPRLFRSEEGQGDDTAFFYKDGKK